MKFEFDVADYLELLFCIESVQNKLEKAEHIEQLERLKQKLITQKQLQEKKRKEMIESG